MATDSLRRPPRSERVTEATADAALAAHPVPLWILVVGSGDGALLSEFAARVPQAGCFVGVDESGMGVTATPREARTDVVRADPVALPFADATFDLVVASTAADAWPDVAGGVAELARVLEPGGTLVIAGSRAGTGQLLTDAGLRVVRRETAVRRGLRTPRIRAYVAEHPAP